ncbi:MAG: class F sortase [Acidimicrobiia bacterium]
MRKQAGIASIAAGIVFAVTATVTFSGIDPSEVGEAGAIERSLTSSSTTTPTTLETSTTEPEKPEPLWQESVNISQESSPGQMPVRVTIGRIGVEANVVPYGVNERTGEMDVPGNVEDVAWYKHGPSPGAQGSAVLAAHVDLAGQGPGVFFDLRELDPGDLIEVGYEDGTQRSFVVEARTTYLKDELPLQTVFSRRGPPVLTLITCGGGFDSSLSSYDSNVVVYAVPVGENNTTDTTSLDQ